MFFNGSYSREGLGVGIVIISLSNEVVSLSYKLEFETTNNIKEYEALLLGLRAAKDMGIQKLATFGDLDLIIHQVINLYQTRQSRLKQYLNDIWDLMDNSFLAFNITFIPRNENLQADSLSLAANNFKSHLHPKIRYEVELRHRPSILDNIKYWRVFDDDIELKRFLKFVE